jgi:hypothetical protein
MEYLSLSVIPAQAGIHWLQGLGDPCLRRDDSKLVFLDTLLKEERKGLLQQDPLIPDP